MNLRDIAESAGLFALHSGQIANGSDPPSADQLYDYASLSRRRLRLWLETLQAEEAGAANRTIVRSRSWVQLANEILVVELLTRVSAAVLAASGAQRGVDDVLPFARRIYFDQLQARQAVLSALVEDLPPLGAALRVNRLRRCTERWADFLIAALHPEAVVVEFAVDADRSADFRESAGRSARRDSRELAVLALRNSMPSENVAEGPRERVHLAITRLLFSLLSMRSFESDGRPRSPLLQQLFNLNVLDERRVADANGRTRRRRSTWDRL